MEVSGQAIREFFFFGITTLFFYELLTDLIKYLYAPNLIALELIPIYLLPLILIVITPSFLLVVDRFASENLMIKFMHILLWVFIAARLSSPIVDTLDLKIMIDTIGVLSGIMFVCLFLALNRDPDEGAGSLGAGFALGLLIWIFFKSFGSTVDLLMHWWTQVIAWLLALIAVVLSIQLYLIRESKFGLSETS